jgi:hypothetical protein
MKGLYCDTTCKKQKNKGDNCTSSYECINSLLCHSGTCSATPFSLDLGTLLDSKDALNAEKCKYGLTALKNNTDPTSLACTYQNQTDAGDAKGFVNCTLGSNCNYVEVASGATVTKGCACGYNANGVGYCPVGINKRDSDWTKFYAKKAASFSADCHTLSRSACYKLGADKLGDISSSYNNLQNEHVFYGAVDCAEDVFGATNYVSISMAMVALLVSLLF